MSKGKRPTLGPVVLIVLDGWGYRTDTEGNAIALGRTPTWDRLIKRCPSTLLEASGTAVGLPAQQMGNSEVGHLNLGAGRVVDQDIVRISRAIDDGSFAQNDSFEALAASVKKNRGTLHLVGLLGTGGVHAVHRHWVGVIQAAKALGVERVALHPFLDGRDTPPESAAGFMRDLVKECVHQSDGNFSCDVATAVGRYFAMDRDKRWDRTQLAYDALVRGVGVESTDPVGAIRQMYHAGTTDEFVKPIVFQTNGRPKATIRTGDGVFGVNFRADRMRQIMRALAIRDFDGFDVADRPDVAVMTMTEYDQTFPFPVAFPRGTFRQMVGQVISEAGLTQLRTAETEKYAHVTYFFNCGVETPFPGEDRQLVPSQKVATYDLMPEMSAAGITDILCENITRGEHDFMLCNFANGDMVGHSGKIEATLQAVETVDSALERVFKAVDNSQATVVVTADHGNCEMMIDPNTGGPHTAHTTNPVPLAVYGLNGLKTLEAGGKLSDVGPTILELLGLEVPAEMSGRNLCGGFPR